MARIKLKAENKNETIVLAYLEENASPSLVERINSGNKTLAQCWNYIVNEARKEAKNGCACIEDNTVYGWAIHFFEEDSIKGNKYKSGPKASVSTSESKEAKPKPKKKTEDVEQLSFADLWG